MKNKQLQFFKVVLLGFFLISKSLQVNAQKMDYTPYEELPSVQKILKPTYSENMPDWGKMLYQYPVNYAEINKAYIKWERENPGVKNALSRYFKLWRMALEPYVTGSGIIEMPNIPQLKSDLLKVQSVSNQMKKAPAVGNTSNWTFLGPKQTFWLNETSPTTVPKAAPWQANVYSIDVTDANPNTLYIGTETGFVNKSIDKGQTWTMSGQRYVFGGAVTAVAIHPTNSDTAYVAAGGKIHRTLNGGTTWAPTGAAFYADRLRIDQKNPSKLLAATVTGLWISTNKSAAWTQKFTTKCWDVRYKPNSSDTIYAITETASNFINMVQSIDGGSTFSKITTFPTTVPQANGGLIAVSANNPNIMYVVILSRNASALEVPFLYKGTLVNGVWNWELKYTGYNGLSSYLGMTNGQGYYDLVLEASPVNENIVYMGTTSLYKSTNGGTSFTAVGGYQGTFSIHPDLQDMKMLANGDTWVTTDGGVNLTTDNFSSTTNWAPLVNGIIGSNMWGFDQGWNEDLIVGGRYHNGNTAIADFYGDKALRMGGGESATGWIIQGKSRSAAFNDLGNGWILPKTAESMPQGRFIFSKYPNMDNYGGLRSNILTHPNYSGTLYVALDSTLWISKDYGVNYDLLYKFTNGKIRYIANSTFNPDVIYVDILGGGFYKSIDGGTSWTRTTSSGAPAWNGNMTFTISPYNSEVIYASRQGSNGEVYKSTNGGTSWASWSAFGKSVKSILIQPTTAGKDLVYACTTSSGSTAATVYYRKDGDAVWTDYGTNYPVGMNVQAAAIFFRDSKLRIAGNAGVWESPLAEPDFTPVLVPWVNKKLISCTLDTVQFEDHSMVNHLGATWNWEITPAPRYISNANSRNPKAVFDNAGKYTVKMTITKGGIVYEKTLVDMFEISSCPSVTDCSNPGDVPKTAWKLVSVDSYQPGNEATKAFDGNSATIWHTAWGTNEPLPPHELVIDLGRSYSLSKMTYLPRTDGSNGRVKDFQLYISDINNGWEGPTTTGTMTNTSAPTTFSFPPTSGRYVRFVALNEVNGNAWSSCAEISFTGCYGTTGLHEISKEFNVKAFPIPAKTNLKISIPLSNGSSANYIIYSSTGTQIETGKLNINQQELSVDVTKYNSGYYFINITDNNGVTYRAKFVKN